MKLPDAVRRFILAVLPWYHEQEVEARHAETAGAVRASVVERRRMQQTIASYRSAGQRISHL